MDITCKLSYDKNKEEELFKLVKDLVFKGKSIEIEDVDKEYGKFYDISVDIIKEYPGYSFECSFSIGDSDPESSLGELANDDVFFEWNGIKFFISEEENLGGYFY